MSFIDDMLSTWEPLIEGVLGDEVTYTPSGGVAATVLGVFDRENVDALDTDGYAPRFEMANDAVASPAAGDLITFDGEYFVVRAVLENEPDENRITLILAETVVIASAFLLETGDALLLETGDKLLLEN